MLFAWSTKYWLVRLSPRSGSEYILLLVVALFLLIETVREGSWACGVCCGVLWEEGVGQVVGQWSSSSHPPPCGVHCA